jgi:hypothetical protein
MRDLPVLEMDDGAEPVVVLRAGREDCSVDFVFDDNDMTCVCCVDNEVVRGLQVDDLNVTVERIHQSGLSPNHRRPTEIVEDFVDGVGGDDVKEVFAVNEVSESTSNQVEVWSAAL